MLRMLGANPMPWQEYAADVIGELKDDGTPRWPIVIISVPRQSGKSTLVKAVAVHRILTKRNAAVWLTAQTGADASELWEECRAATSLSPLAPLFHAKKARGSEALTCTATRGVFRPHPPTEEKLHGKQSDLNIIDEAWAFDEAQAHALMQAIVPTQFTRKGAQIIIVSTMGTARSTWFHGYVSRARSGDQGMALLEWGIEPGDDASDLEVVANRHPAYGHVATMATLENAFKAMNGNLGEFARAYGNRATGSRERLIPLDAWQRAQSTETIPPTARVTFAAAVDVDRTETAIAAAWLNPETGVTHCEVIERRPGTTWAGDHIQRLLKRHDNAGIVIDKISPAGTVADELGRRKIEVIPVKTSELVTACQSFFDAVVTDPPGVAILPNEALDTAAEIVEHRRIGDGWAWGRRSAGSITTLEAVTLAMHGARHIEPPAQAPRVRF